MTAEIVTPRAATPIQLPTRNGATSQATAVEQSRAVAEVQAAVIVAQQCPRDIQQAMQQMRDACAQMYLAERAFFRYNRAGSSINGPSVHLARELARCWGNVQYGITELKRDAEAGESEMLAFAWDVQTNTRSSNSFIVAHVRDTKKGQTRLEDQRDIYENNANMGARRLREAIFSVLPPWFVAEAKQRCRETVEGGGGIPLATRIENALGKFASRGVSRAQLEAKVGHPCGSWTDADAAQLAVIWQSIVTGELTVVDEFPAVDAPVTVAAVQEQAQRRGRAARPVQDPDEYAPADQQGDDPWAKDGEGR